MDCELLEHAIRDAGLWYQVREVVLPVNVNTITGELGAEACFRKLRKHELKRHHVLADALVALGAAYIDVKAATLAHIRTKNTPQA
jgi:hypothetical protein